MTVVVYLEPIRCWGGAHRWSEIRRLQEKSHSSTRSERMKGLNPATHKRVVPQRHQHFQISETKRFEYTESNLGNATHNLAVARQPVVCKANVLRRVV